MNLNFHFSYLLNKIFLNWLYFIIIKNKKFELVILISFKFLNNILFFLKKSIFTRFELLMDIIAIDKPYSKTRFILVYKLTSICFNYNLLLNINLKQNTGVTSALNLYNSAGWLEREVWDFFGIYFYNHNDLRRILTDYGFSGFPLRKDFPLSGYFEIFYIDEKKRVVLEPLDFSQEFRFFHFKSPWE